MRRACSATPRWASRGLPTSSASTASTALQRPEITVERGPLLTAIEISSSRPAMAAADGSSIMGLEPGEEVSLETLLYGMMLPSGNDAAEQVALALAGSRQVCGARQAVVARADDNRIPVLRGKLAYGNGQPNFAKSRGCRRTHIESNYH